MFDTCRSALARADMPLCTAALSLLQAVATDFPALLTGSVPVLRQLLEEEDAALVQGALNILTRVAQTVSAKEAEYALCHLCSCNLSDLSCSG